MTSNDNDNNEITSKEIVRLLKKIEDVQSDINTIKTEIQQEESLLVKLDEEYGSEITRIKKEFARMKERSFEEATEISNQAKVGALKEVLPITDNYFRAKSVFEPLTTDDEKFVAKTYDDVFSAFSKVIEDFGVTRVLSIGQPFDFNFMEAIMTQPSTEYPADIVCVEYQVGYKIGDKCIRPSMVVVSAGPGPSK
jgi:molecular chaperone GrpE